MCQNISNNKIVQVGTNSALSKLPRNKAQPSFQPVQAQRKMQAQLIF